MHEQPLLIVKIEVARWRLDAKKIGCQSVFFNRQMAMAIVNFDVQYYSKLLARGEAFLFKSCVRIDNPL